MTYKVIPLLTKQQTRSFQRRLKQHRNGCLLWTAKAPDGRGKINLSAKAGSFLASRIAYALEHNYPDISNVMVLHTCDNPLCCNTNHLYLGNQSRNMQDKAERMRGPTKLNADIIRQIRVDYSEGMSFRKLACKFGTTSTTMWNIINGKCWRFVT